MNNLYFIAIIPPKEIADSIMAIQKEFGRRFDTEAALKVMPHITLKAPFLAPVSEHTDLLLWFEKIYTGFGRFDAGLKDFGAFPNKSNPVIYLRVVMNVPLYALQKEIIRRFQIRYPELEIPDGKSRFRPHITIAYRDLPPEKFPEAWSMYKTKEFKTVFTVSRFHLLQHNGKMWNIIKTHDITGDA